VTLVMGSAIFSKFGNRADLIRQNGTRPVRSNPFVDDDDILLAGLRGTFDSPGVISGSMNVLLGKRGAFDSAKNHKRQRRKCQSVTAKREKSQTPKFV